MFKKATCCFLAIALATFTATLSVQAAGGKGGASGGGGGGGATKPLTIRWTGIITNIQPGIGGIYVTLGTSYYAVGTGIVTPDTKIKLNGSSSNVTVEELRIGDSAQMDVIWPSRFATKMEVIGVR